ncbi:hypothetical protein ACTQZS_05025 [Bilifractor sp. LCP19S3_H10]|uniref:hypothetical protein n=1 Tax=Bilifractor sp. LCP19S3_H10 TaxID=3438736 RepID=UPI003F929A04
MMPVSDRTGISEDVHDIWYRIRYRWQVNTDDQTWQEAVSLKETASCLLQSGYSY